MFFNFSLGRSTVQCTHTVQYVQYSTVEEGLTYTEEKAKAVAAVCGTEFIQFLAALAVLDKDDMKKRTHCTRMVRRKG